MVLDDFFSRALIGGVGVALLAGPVGCLIVWKRLAYLGDSLSHAALLGIALGLALGFDLTLGTIAVCITLVMLFLISRRQRRIGSDSFLVILAHGSLALGLISVTFLEGAQLDLMSYLFGDILTISHSDIMWIYLIGASIIAVIAFFWKTLLSVAIDEELTRAEGAPAMLASVVFMLIIAASVAIAMKMVGVLLIASMLVIPAATARRISNSPEQMAVFASIVGCIAVIGGLFGSMEIDTPAGPSIIAAALSLFILSLLGATLFNKYKQMAIQKKASEV